MSGNNKLLAGVSNADELTGRDLPQLYYAIVGGEGGDFVAQILSTEKQVRFVHSRLQKVFDFDFCLLDARE
jgi:hypothetical protein